MLDLFEHKAVAEPPKKTLDLGADILALRKRRRFVIQIRAVKGQRVIKNIPQRPAFFHPAAQVPAAFPGNRGRLPGILHSRGRYQFRIDVAHVTPGLRESAHVTEAVRPPAGTPVGRIGQAFAAAYQHQQRRLAKGRGVSVDNLFAIGHRRYFPGLRAAHMPLAPPADRSDIDVVDVRVPVVSLAEPADEVQVPLKNDRIVEVGHEQPFGACVVACQYFAADVFEPVGVIRIVRPGRTAHRAERQPLARQAGLVEHLVEKRIVNFALLGFECVPAPSCVVNARRNPSGQILIFAGGVMERLPAHPWIRKNLIGLSRPDFNRRSGRGGFLNDLFAPGKHKQHESEKSRKIYARSIRTHGTLLSTALSVDVN